MKKRSIHYICLAVLLLLCLPGCTSQEKTYTQLEYLEQNVRLGTAPEDYAGWMLVPGSKSEIVVFVTQDGNDSLRHWQRLLQDDYYHVAVVVAGDYYNMNTAQAWWEEIRQAPYGETYIDYDFTMTCGYEWTDQLGWRVYLRTGGPDGQAVFNLMGKKYGDFIQPLTQEQAEDYLYKQTNSIAGAYLYEFVSARTQINEIEDFLGRSWDDFKYETRLEWKDKPFRDYPGYWEVWLHLDYWDAGAQEIRSLLELSWCTGIVRVKADIDDDFTFETDTPGYSAGYTGSK